MQGPKKATGEQKNMMKVDVNDLQNNFGEQEQQVEPASPIRRGAFSAGPLQEDNMNTKVRKVEPKDKRSRGSLSRAFNANVLFSHLDENERNDISDAMFLDTAESGDVIMQQGDEGDNFYIVDQACW